MTASNILAKKLSNDNKNKFVNPSKNLVVWTFKSWDVVSYKWEKINMKDKIYKLKDINFFYTIKNNDKSYKSNLLEDLEWKEFEFRTFSNKNSKLKINSSTLIDISKLDKKTYNLSYNIVLFLQWEDDKLYVITASKTNYSLLLEFFESNGMDYDIEFSLWYKPYTVEWFDFMVIDYILKDDKKIINKEFDSEIQLFHTIFNS